MCSEGQLQRLTAKDVLIVERLENKSLEEVACTVVKDSDESSNSIINL